MLDFATLPPEINSARMYLGPGPAPMIAASSAWYAVADMLSILATEYGSVLSELTDRGWLGPSSLAMAKAAAPYVLWLHTTAAKAEQTAAQAKAAAAAYELAFAMTVPPSVIAANRSLFMALVATNFFGQNAAAIAATEAHYAEMWLQDATAMYGYAGSSAAARRLTQFTEPSSTSNPTSAATQSGATAHAAGAQHGTLSQLLSTTPGALQQSPNPPAVSNPSLFDYLLRVPNITNSTLSTSNAVTSGRNIFITNTRLAFQEAEQPQPPPEVAAGLASVDSERPVGSALSGVRSGLGRAGLVGQLSVPPSWFATAPEIQPAALALPGSAAGTVSAASAGIPPVPGSVFSQSVLGTLSRHGTNTQQHKSKPIIVRSPAAG
jgi:PPE-repeat protein